MPFLKNPESGTWNGPDVAISTIPGKNHMLHQVYEGSLYPHFSVRSKDWRYSLASTGEEELYNNVDDPFEWKNLAHDPAHSIIKASLKAQLIELREGDRWDSLESLASWTMPSGIGEYSQRRGEIRLSGSGSFELATLDDYEHFELEVDVRAQADNAFRIAYRGSSGNGVSTPTADSDEASWSKLQNGEWNRYRIRVHNGRHQLWINNRYVSDYVEDDSAEAGPIRILFNGGGDLRLRSARVRAL
jgi:hypothetical protein